MQLTPARHPRPSVEAMTAFNDDASLQVWEYTVSHRQLLLRRPSTPTDPHNHDYLFVGVQFVSLPTLIPAATVVDIASLDRDEVPVPIFELRRGLTQYVVRGRDAWGFVIAEAMRESTTEGDPFDPGVERWGDARSAAERFERQALLALSSLQPVLEPRIPSNSLTASLDALVELNHRRIGVEVKWVNPNIANAPVRSRVIRSIESLGGWIDHLDGLVFVVATRSPRAIEEARAHLRTAFPIDTEVIGWTGDDDGAELVAAVRRLAGLST